MTSSTSKNLMPDQVASTLMETTPLIMHFIRNKVKERPDNNTSAQQIRVMGFIDKYPGCSLTPLSDSLGITSASASTMIDRLVKAGFVDRVVDPTNRRNLSLKLTPLGQRELGGAKQISQQALAHKLHQLDSDQLAHVSECMDLLKNIFSTQSDAKAHKDEAYATNQPSNDWKRGSVES